MTHRTPAIAALPLAIALASCATPRTVEAPQGSAFWEALASHCGGDGPGRAYAGSLATDDARDADFRGKRMIAHWAECTPDRIAIAFHIEDAEAPGGWDRSRTWLLTRDRSGAGALLLKHDHRHADGSVDAVTRYGGWAAPSTDPRARDFPVDDESIALFEREGLGASLTNVWRVEADPAGDPQARFVYQLTRRNDPTRLFRVAFDASEPIAPPPPAWGWE